MTLIFNEGSAPGKRTAVRDLLRQRLGDDVTASRDKVSVFLYAKAASAAQEAEHAARDVLAQEGLTADIQVECWDPVRKEWRDPQVEPPEDEDKPGRRSTLGDVVEIVLPYLGELRT